MRSKGFFYNLAGFVFEYFCDSRRILATFAKFCLNSLFATWSYRYLNPKHVIQRALKLPFISHTCFFDTKLYKPLPLFAFFYVYEVTQSPHENSMSGANTRSVLARSGDNSWEKDFVKPFYVKKLVWEMEGSLSARAGWRVKRYDPVAKSELRQNFAKVAKILQLSQKNSKTNLAKL